MRKSILLLTAVLGLSIQVHGQVLSAGDVQITFTSTDEGYSTQLSYQGNDIPFFVPGQPATIDVKRRTRSALYHTVTPADSGIFAKPKS